jgi:hypothetical protein
MKRKMDGVLTITETLAFNPPSASLDGHCLSIPSSSYLHTRAVSFNLCILLCVNSEREREREGGGRVVKFTVLGFSAFSPTGVAQFVCPK